MKKLIAAVLACMMFVTVCVSCGSKDNTSSEGANTVVNLEGTLPEIIEKIYETKLPEIPLMTTEVDIANADVLKSFTGLSSADKVSAVAASEAAIGSQAYSLVLARLKDAADAEAVATEMKNGIDQRKWICVEADDMRVVAYGDVVMLIMVSSELSEVATADQMVDAFTQTCGGTLTVDLK